MKLYDMTAHQLRTLLDKGEVSAVDIAESVLDRIHDVDEDLGTYITVRREAVIKEAEEADRRLKEGDRVGPLTGIPIGLKDNVSTDGTRTSCASKMLESYVPPYDATVAARFKEQGAPLLGKQNMDEFAMGSGTEHSAFFPTKNPWDRTRVPGGSSGGSAAATAAGTAVMTVGSDTGGSIRQPAAYCGVVGLKPTYGRVSRYGLIPLAPSLDAVGPITKDVRDAALSLTVMSGDDGRDTTCVDGAVPDFVAALKGDVRGMVIGLPQELMGDGVEPEVKDAVLKAVSLLEEAGARVQEVHLSHLPYAPDAYHILAAAEAASSLGRFDGVRFGYRADSAEDVTQMFLETRRRGFGPEVKRRIMRGTYTLGASRYQDAYVKAQKVRTLIIRDFADAFSTCTLLAAPTAPSVAYALGRGGDDPAATAWADRLTVPANLAGIPAVSVPCGLSADGLPIGLQLMAPAFAEASLLNAAYTYEQAAGLLPLIPENL